MVSGRPAEKNKEPKKRKTRSLARDTLADDSSESEESCMVRHMTQDPVKQIVKERERNTEQSEGAGDVLDEEEDAECWKENENNNSQLRYCFTFSSMPIEQKQRYQTCNNLSNYSLLYTIVPPWYVFLCATWVHFELSFVRLVHIGQISSNWEGLYYRMTAPSTRQSRTLLRASSREARRCS